MSIIDFLPQICAMSGQGQENPIDVYVVNLMVNPESCFKSSKRHFEDRYCVYDLDK